MFVHMLVCSCVLSTLIGEMRYAAEEQTLFMRKINKILRCHGNIREFTSNKRKNEVPKLCTHISNHTPNEDRLKLDVL